jgi:hypothetical protein
VARTSSSPGACSPESAWTMRLVGVVERFPETGPWLQDEESCDPAAAPAGMFLAPSPTPWTVLGADRRSHRPP